MLRLLAHVVVSIINQGCTNSSPVIRSLFMSTFKTFNLNSLLNIISSNNGEMQVPVEAGMIECLLLLSVSLLTALCLNLHKGVVKFMPSNNKV